MNGNEMRTLNQIDGCDRFATAATLKAIAELNQRIEKHNAAVRAHLAELASVSSGVLDCTKAVEIAERVTRERIALPAEAVALLEERQRLRQKLNAEFQPFQQARAEELKTAKEKAEVKAGKVYPQTILGWLEKRADMVDALTRTEQAAALWKPGCFSSTDATDIANARRELGAAIARWR
jgi:uncharacterized secreted protein with C-terminal beta-propeller domain